MDALFETRQKKVNLIQNLREEIKNSLGKDIDSRLDSQRKTLANAAPRSLHFTGSFGCYFEGGEMIHINIPTGTDKTEELKSIVDRVLENELSITLDECLVVKDTFGISNKILEFYLPRGII